MAVFVCLIEVIYLVAKEADSLGASCLSDHLPSPKADTDKQMTKSRKDTPEYRSTRSVLPLFTEYTKKTLNS